MDKFIITSMRPSAGKTSLIIGLAKALNNKLGYMKPFGARFILCSYGSMNVMS